MTSTLKPLDPLFHKRKLRATTFLSCPYKSLFLAFETKKMVQGRRVHEYLEALLAKDGYVIEDELIITEYRGWRLVAHPDAYKFYKNGHETIKKPFIHLIEIKSTDKFHPYYTYQIVLYKEALYRKFNCDVYACLLYRTPQGWIMLNDRPIIPKSLIMLGLVKKQEHVFWEAPGILRYVEVKFRETVEALEAQDYDSLRWPGYYCIFCKEFKTCQKSWYHKANRGLSLEGFINGSE